MTIPSKIVELASLALPARRTVRFRLTLLYGGLFLACGAALLGITYGLVAGQSVTGGFVPSSTSGSAPPSTGGHTGSFPNPGGAGSATSGGAVASGGHTQIGHVPSQARFDINIGQSATLHHMLDWSGVALAIMAVVALALGWLVAGRVLRPVRSMTRTTQHITQDNLHQRLALSGPDDELKELGDTIDGLLGRLEGAFDAQRRFVANVTHELRTPLATMRLAVDVAMGKPQPPPPQSVALATKMHKGLDQIDRLLESLLALSKLQLGTDTDLAILPLDRIVATSIQAQATAITGGGLTIQAVSNGDTSVAGDETLLARMVDNVTDNAIRHNQPGGWIQVTTDSNEGRVRLTIETGGPVLDPHAVQALAQPFRRLGTERTGSDNGSGLGLSIVAAITEAHQGTLELHARPEGGLGVIICLPAAHRLAAAGLAP